MSNIKERFKSFIAPDSFQRVDQDHLLDLYIGIDLYGKKVLMLISDKKPPKTASSKSIDILVTQRHDERWVTSFRLIEDDKDILFYKLCEDIIESSRGITSIEIGPTFVINRFIKWQRMMSKSLNGLLTESEIKGLMGELIFMRDWLIPKYGENLALKSWIGPDKSDQDFIINDTWYEVKSVNNGAGSIKISSIEQLDTVNKGFLAVITLERTTSVDENGVTINDLVNDIESHLTSQENKDWLISTLINFGYVERIEYNEYIYKFIEVKRYNVNDRFPKVHRRSVPAAVINAVYELSLSAIEEYQIDN